MDCKSCGTLKRERLDFLADNPLYTKRFAYYVEGQPPAITCTSGCGQNPGHIIVRVDDAYQFDIISLCISYPSKCFASSGKNIQKRKRYCASGTQLWNSPNSETLTMFESFLTLPITSHLIRSLMWAGTTIA